MRSKIECKPAPGEFVSLSEQIKWNIKSLGWYDGGQSANGSANGVLAMWILCECYVNAMWILCEYYWKLQSFSNGGIMEAMT